MAGSWIRGESDLGYHGLTASTPPATFTPRQRGEMTRTLSLQAGLCSLRTAMEAGQETWRVRKRSIAGSGTNEYAESGSSRGRTGPWDEKEEK